MPWCFASLPYNVASLPTPCAPLVFAWLMTLPLAKQITWQSQVPKVVCQASCLCSSNIKGNLPLHTQNHRQLACAQAEPKAACQSTGKMARQSRRQSICRKPMPYAHSFCFSGKGNVWPWSPQPIPFLRGARSVHGHGDIPFSFPDLTGESVVMATTTHVLFKKEAGGI